MTSDQAHQRAKLALGDEMLRTIPGGGGRLDDSLKHGCAIYRGAKQLASGYVSDNEPWHAVEFALNQELLAELAFERAALMRWLEHQKQHYGGRKPKVHQRGIPAEWFRIGFASTADASTFLAHFFTQRKRPDVRARWAITEGGAIGASPPVSGPVVAEVAPAEAAPAPAMPPREGRRPDAVHELLEDAEQDEWDEVDEGIEEHAGNLSNEDYALACIPVLVDHVLHQSDEVMQKLTYEELARRLGRLNKHRRPSPRGMGAILGRAMEHIDHAAVHASVVPPYLTTIAVEKAVPTRVCLVLGYANAGMVTTSSRGGRKPTGSRPSTSESCNSAASGTSC